MKFDYLKNSIEINANEEPSVFLALCMIETIFRDIRSESGAELSHLAVGDDKWSLKMSLVYRYLRNIFDANSDDVTRGQKQLEELQVSSRQIELELEENSELLSEIIALKKSIDEKTETIRKTKLEKETLIEQTENLSSVLDKLRAEVAKLEMQCNDEDSVNVRKQLRSRKEHLQQELDALNQEEASLNSNLLELSAKLKVHKQEYEKLLSQNDEYSKELRLYSEKIDELRMLDSQREQLQAKKDALQKQKTDLEDIITKLHDQNQQLEFDIGIDEQKSDEISAHVSQLQEEVKTLKDNIDKLVLQRDALESEKKNYYDTIKQYSELSVEQRKVLIEKYKNQTNALKTAVLELQSVVISVCGITGRKINGQEELSSLMCVIDNLGDKIESLRVAINKVSQSIKSEVFVP